MHQTLAGKFKLDEKRHVVVDHGSCLVRVCMGSGVSRSPRLTFLANLHHRCIRRDLWFDRAKAEHNDIGLEVRLLGEAMRIIGSHKDIIDMPPAAMLRNRVPTGMLRKMTIKSTPGLRRYLALAFFLWKLVVVCFHGRN